MDKSAFYLFVFETVLLLAFIAYLWLVEQLTFAVIWQEWGIPLLLYVTIFTAFPVYRLVTAVRK